MPNILANPGFEDGEWCMNQTDAPIDEIHVPRHWIAFWLEKKEVAHDPENKDGYLRPEFTVIHKSGQYVDPVLRISEGEYALKIHAQWKIYKAGIYQQLHVPEGTDLSVRVKGHAWSSREDDAEHSDVDTDNDFENITLYVGIDPKGGKDPTSLDVDWSMGISIYDEFDVVGPMHVTSIGNTVTAFILAVVRWPFKHLDVYFDDAIVYVEGWPGDECPKPRDGWTHRTTVLVRPDAPMDVWLTACEWAGHPNRRFSVDKSRDHALYAPGLEQVQVILWMDNPEAFDVEEVRGWGIEHYSSTQWFIDQYPATPVDPDPIDPEPNWTPRRYVPVGWLGGIHALGDDGTSEMFLAMNAQGATMPSVKAVQDIGWMREVWLENKSCLTIGRFINDGEPPSLEGFHYFEGMTDSDIYNQAMDRINVLEPLWEPYRDFVKAWEFMNEQKAAHVDGCRAKTMFNMCAMRIASDRGYRLAVLSDSTGTPEPYEWDIMASMYFFEEMVAFKSVMALHEYGVMPIDLGLHLTRFTYPYDNHILPRHLDIPLVISEWAPDPWGGIAGFSMQELMTQVAAYDLVLAQYPYVAGFHIYTLGGTGSWKAHRDAWNACRTELVNYAISRRDRING